MMMSMLAACDSKEPTTPSEDPSTNDPSANTPSASDDPSGTDDDGYKTLAEQTGYGYVASYTKLDGDFQWASGLKQLSNGRLMMQADSVDEDGMYTSGYYTMNPDGTDIQPMTMPQFDGNEYIQNYALTDDGIWVVTYEWWSTGTASSGDMVVYATEVPAVVVGTATAETAVEVESEPAEEEASDDWMNTTQGDDWTGDETADDSTTDDQVDDDIWIDTDDGGEAEPEEPYQSYEIYRLYKADLEGNIIAQPDITALTESVDYFYIQNMAAAPDGTLILVSDQSVYHLDESGKLIGTLELENWVNTCAMLPSGELMLSFYGDNGIELYLLNTETMELGEAVEIDANTIGNFIPGGGSYDLYMTDDNCLYGFDLESGETTALLNWMDSDVESSSAYNCAIIDETKILFIYQQNEGGIELCTLNRVPYSELPVRETITLGGNYLNYDIRNMVTNFNRTNETYRISFIDYSQYQSEESPNGGADRLSMELNSGRGPDILLNSLISNNKALYISKGFLVDLYTLMEEQTKNSLVEGYRRAEEVDGGLYLLAPSFSISGFWTNAEYLGDDGVLSLDELMAACQALPEGGRILDYETRESVLQSVLATSYQDLIDLSTGECYFDTPDFAKLLEYAALFPAEIDWETYEVDNSKRYISILEKTKIFEVFYLYNLSDMNWTLADMGGTDGFAIVGMPGIGGDKMILTTDTGMAINANSQYQQVCWEFVSQLLGDEYQEQNSWQISVLQNKLEEQAQKATQKPYYIDENGEKVEYEQTYYNSLTGENEPLLPLSQEQVDQFMEVINSVDGSTVYDEELFKIVVEEAGAYFAGQKPAEEVARLIQSRVWTYINEQR